MIGWFLHRAAARRQREGRLDDVFSACLLRARDGDAYGTGVWGYDGPLPWWATASQRDVRIAFGSPHEFLFVLDEIEQRTGKPIRDVWPHWRTFVHSGLLFAPYAELYRKRAGHGVVFVEACFSDDGMLLAVQDRPDDDSLLALAAIEDRETHAAGEGRIRLGKSSRFALNAFGECLAKQDLGAALLQSDGDVLAFTILPEYPTVRDSRGRHAWLIECGLPPRDLSDFERALDAALAGRSENYGRMRRDGRLRAPVARLVRAGAFEEWRTRHGEVPCVIDQDRVAGLLP